MNRSHHPHVHAANTSLDNRAAETHKGESGGTTRAHLGMLLWALFVGLSFPAVGLLSDDLPPLLLTAMRFAIAALVLAPLAWSQSEGRPGWRTMLL